MKAPCFVHRMKSSFFEEKMVSSDTLNIVFIPITRNANKLSSGLEGDPSDVVCQEDGSPSPAVKTPTITEEDVEGVSGRILGFIIEFVSILLQKAKR